MYLTSVCFIFVIISLLIEPFSALHLIASGVFVVGGTLNLLLRTYLTYILEKDESGEVYIGRTSGFGEPHKILRRRMYNHDYCKMGFGNPILDRAAQGLRAKDAIRGREQQLIDYYGGIGHPRVANAIRAVSMKNRNRQIYHKRSNEFFGELYYYTGN